MNLLMKGQLITLLRNQGKTVHLSAARTYDRAAVLQEIEEYKPTHILNAAGVTGPSHLTCFFYNLICVIGRPNVDWCEDHKAETIRSNVIGTITIADICEEKKIVSIS